MFNFIGLHDVLIKAIKRNHDASTTVAQKKKKSVEKTKGWPEHKATGLSHTATTEVCIRVLTLDGCLAFSTKAEALLTP